MPLSQVQSGMQCTGYSVVRGTTISSFDVDVVDVIDARARHRLGADPRHGLRTGGGRDGHRPRLLGLADLLSRRRGVQQNIGAISESIGDYGGKTVLATPIELMLANPRRPAEAADAGDGGLAARGRRAPEDAPPGHEAARRAAHDRRRIGQARPRARADRQADRPPGDRRARRARSARFPVQTLQPGLRRLGGLLERRPAPRRRRHRRVHGRRPRVGVRPPVRGRRARARCCSRTPTSSRSSTTRTRRSRAARTSSLSPATTSAP